jgi:hypothetical protein
VILFNVTLLILRITSGTFVSETSVHADQIGGQRHELSSGVVGSNPIRGIDDCMRSSGVGVDLCPIMSCRASDDDDDDDDNNNNKQL